MPDLEPELQRGLEEWPGWSCQVERRLGVPEGKMPGDPVFNVKAE